MIFAAAQYLVAATGTRRKDHAMSEKYPEYADPQLRPRYLGLPTFMRAPYAEDLANVDIAMVGVPFDGGVTNRPGARHGPREVRNQSSLIRTPPGRILPAGEERQLLGRGPALSR